MSKSNTEVEDVTAEIEAAAYDFARHDKGGGGWAFGLDVAACVGKGIGQGSPHRDHDEVGKVSAQEFGRQAGTSADRVLRFLKAWDSAAAQGIVASSADLTPADWYDVDHLPTGYDWNDFFDASAAGGRPRDSKPEDAAKIIERRGAEAVLGKLTDEQVEEVVETAARTRPEASQRGLVKERSARLPAPPFTAAPPSVNVDPLSERIMDFQAKVYRLHALLVDMGIDVHDCPEAAAGEADRLDREADLIKMIAASARGISDKDLIALLEVES